MNPDKTFKIDIVSETFWGSLFLSSQNLIPSFLRGLGEIVPQIAQSPRAHCRRFSLGKDRQQCSSGCESAENLVCAEDEGRQHSLLSNEGPCERRDQPWKPLRSLSTPPTNFEVHGINASMQIHCCCCVSPHQWMCPHIPRKRRGLNLHPGG